IERYLRFPTTFDGKLPSEAFGHATSRVKIGETYFFANVGDRDITGTVTAATVDELNKLIIIGVSTDTEHTLLRVPMSDGDLAEWKEFGDAFFGKVPMESSSHTKNEYEMFEWFMEVYKDWPRDQMVARFVPGSLDFGNMTDEDLRIVYCENLV